MFNIININSKQDIIFKNFFFIFSILPISILVGPAVSSINIMIISLSFLTYAFYLKDWKWLKNRNIKLFFILYFYLIFNSFIAVNFEISVNRNFGFIQYILFFAAFNYFFSKYEKFNKIFYVWFVVIFIVVLDVYLETFTGRNMLGYDYWNENLHNRIYSFFIDEAKVGGFIGCFFLLLTGYFLDICQLKSKKLKYFIVLVSIFFLLSIIFTGERSNTIKALLALLVLFMLSRSFSIKEKAMSIVMIILISVIIYSSFNFIKYRYGQLIFNNLSSIKEVIKHVKKTDFKPNEKKQVKISKEEHEIFARSLGSNYFHLYVSGLKVFVKYPIFGAGNKNFRVVTCTNYAIDENGIIGYYQLYKYKSKAEKEIYNSEYICSTHPHQIYFEFLAEHGIVGTLILLFVFFRLIYQAFKKINANANQNNLQLASLAYIVLFFIPLLPSGSFFNNYGSVLLWINLSIMMFPSKSNSLIK